LKARTQASKTRRDDENHPRENLPSKFFLSYLKISKRNNRIEKMICDIEDQIIKIKMDNLIEDALNSHLKIKKKIKRG